MATQQTWKIRSQLPTGKWGPERTVTLVQYRAELDAAKAHAAAEFKRMYPSLAGLVQPTTQD